MVPQIPPSLPSGVILQQKLDNDQELGVSIAVNIDGKNVLDLWGGYADPARTKEWTHDTLAPVWSISKIVTAIAANILISRGLLDPDEKVSKYWPEFAANGKQDILVSHILSHSSGVSGWEAPTTLEDIYDTAASTKKLAQQAPWWTPGTQLGYHLLNQGHLVGELARRVSGKSLTRFIADEIADPLGAEFTLGVPEERWERTAEMVPPPPLSMEGLGEVALKTFTVPPLSVEATGTAGFRKAEIGGANGFSNARALARIGEIVALGGTVDRREYLSRSVVEEMLRERTNGVDLVAGLHLRWGLGVGLPVLKSLPWMPEGQIGFWGGWGGSVLIMDVERRMSIAYVMNKMGAGMVGNAHTGDYLKAVYDIVSSLKY